MRTGIAILGAGGHARETYWHLMGAQPGAPVVFVDDITDARAMAMGRASIPVVKDWRFSEIGVAGECVEITQFLIGVGDPKVKRVLVERALQSGLTPLPTVVHPHALIQDPECLLGRGGVIAPGCVLTTNIRLGDYVVLNRNCTVGHDAVIGDYVTVNPGASISGNVYLGEGVLLGTGTVIREKIRIAPNVITGAQSCVVQDIELAGITVAGVPARPLAPPFS